MNTSTTLPEYCRKERLQLISCYPGYILSYISSFFSICSVIQIGFEQKSYTVSERDGSIRVCAHLKDGTITFPVSIQLITVDVESAEGG